MMPTKQVAISEKFQLFQNQKHLITWMQLIPPLCRGRCTNALRTKPENAMIPTVESIKDAIRKTYNKE